MYKVITVLLLLTSLFYTSCQTSPCTSKAEMLTHHSELVDEAMTADRSPDDARWEPSDAGFEQLVTECYEQYEGELTAEEQRTFWVNTLRYLTHRYGRSLWRELTNPDTKDEIVVAFRSHSDKLVDELGGLEALIEQELQDGSALDDLLDGLGRELNRFFERIQERQMEEEGTPM